MTVVHVESGSGRLLLRLPLVMAVLLALCIEVTRARAFQLDECPVGCGSHGACRQGLCECASGWSGQDCSYFLAASGSDEDDTLDEVEDCVDDCSRHGTCAGGICHCDAGFGGLSCNVAAQCSETCKQPRGQCSAGSCVCAAGFFGPECGDALCPSNCFGHGACNNGACECSQGWFGRLCDSQLDAASDCDPPCGNSGQCVGGQCYCGPGFTGIDCSMQVQVTPAQAATLAATPQSGLERPAQAPRPEVHTAPPPRFVQTTGMENRLHDLQVELEDVQRRTKMLKGKSEHRSAAASPAHLLQSGNQHLMLTQVDGRGVQMPPDLEAVMGASAAPQPSSMKNNLEAVRRATRAAGSAADKLRHTAEKEFAEAAKRRVQSAIKTAHDRVRSIPGFEESGPTAPPVPTQEPGPGPAQSLSINFNPPSAVAHAAVAPVAPAARDLDNEDSPDTTEDTSTAEESLLKVYADSASVPGAHSFMVASAPAAAGPPVKCESDCGGHGMCQALGGGATCKCAPNWVGMLCDTQRCENDCNGRGMCLKGHCLCGPGWLGSSCGYMRCQDDCSGVGYCFTGRCRCKTGYEGPSCAQVRPAGLSLAVKVMPMPLIKAPPPINEHYEGMTLRAIPPRVCPSNCNGRGSCRTNGECACNVGYSGVACELFCPNECSHNGDCVEGACLCFAGFLGVDCSIAGCCTGHGTCDDPGVCVCNTGWDGDDCSLKLMCADPGCSGHGTCAGGKCTCTAGFSGATCAIADGGCVPPCGPSGACNPVSHKCECAGGAAGPTCLETIQSCPKNCNNKGLCMNGMCMCGVGWMGIDCGKKFFKPGQKPPPPAAKPGAGGSGGAGGGLAGGMPSIVGLGGGAGGAGGAGGEDVDDADAVAPGAPGGGDAGGPPGSGGGDKKASEEESGEMVLAKASGGMVCGEGGFCSGHGTCDTASATCRCEPMYFGDICEQQHCPGFFKIGKDCYGNGLCEMGQCQCAPGYGMAPFRMLGAKPLPQACMDKVCPVGCGMHGKCVEGQCVCQQGWQGPNCKDPKCPNDCAGHGQCAFQSIHSPGQCICNYGWGGAGCQRVAVYAQLKKCPNDCAGNGLCMDGFCACNVGFKGPDCSDIVCAGMMTGPKCNTPRCPNDCSGRGLCMNGMCACWSFYAGAECQMPVVCQENCGEVCETPGREEHCQSCIGMCESSAPRSNHPMGGASLGAHNVFEDLQSTLLQQNTTARKPGHRSEWPAARLKTKKSHSHHSHHEEVYQRPEEPHGTAFISTGAHAAHHHGHHHEEVSAIRVIPAVRSVF